MRLGNGGPHSGRDTPSSPRYVDDLIHEVDGAPLSACIHPTYNSTVSDNGICKVMRRMFEVPVQRRLNINHLRDRPDG